MFICIVTWVSATWRKQSEILEWLFPSLKNNIPPQCNFPTRFGKEIGGHSQNGGDRWGEWKLDSNQGNLARLWKNPLWVRVFPYPWAAGEAGLLGFFSAEAVSPSLIPWSMLCTSNNKYKLLRRVASEQHGAPWIWNVQKCHSSNRRGAM